MNQFLDCVSLLPESGLPAGAIDLSRNENFRGRHMRFDDIKLNRYPSQMELKAILANHNSVTPEQITIGNGATDLLSVCARASLRSGRCAQIKDRTYNAIYNIVRKTGAATSNNFGDVLFLVNPNNPTGEFQEPEFVNPEKYELVVVDEAYLDYHPDKYSFVEMVNNHRNVVVIRTFSKLHGLAGMRIGYSISSKEVSAAIAKSQNQYPVSAISIQAAIESIDDWRYRHYSIVDTEESRLFLKNGLDALGVKIYGGCANFITAKVPKVEGFQVRDLSSYIGMRGLSRITVASVPVMEEYLNKLKDALK